MTEQWRTVPEYEGWYEVSDQGNVRSIDRTVQDTLGRYRRMPGRLLRTTKKHRHYCVTLSRGRKDCRSVYVHHLVLRAFVGPRPDGQLARHLDDNAADNRLINLAYGTPSENNLDAVRNGRVRTKRRPIVTEQGEGKERMSREQIDLLGALADSIHRARPASEGQHFMRDVRQGHASHQPVSTHEGGSR